MGVFSRLNTIFVIVLIFVLIFIISVRADFSIVVAIIALFALFYAIISSSLQIDNLSEQLKLLQKHVFGEVYEKAQIKRVEFAPLFHGKQKKPDELLREIKIRAKKKTEIGIHWKMDARQGLRCIVSGFNGKIKKKPIIMDTVDRFVVDRKESFTRERYRDCHGYFHVEYPHSRIVPDNEDFEIGYKVKIQQKGGFILNIHIYTDEAKEPFKDQLKVKII